MIASATGSIATGQHWGGGAEDFEINAHHLRQTPRPAPSLSAQSPDDPMEKYIAQRNAFAQEMAQIFPCLPTHRFTVDQRIKQRDWHERCVGLSNKNPALAAWHEKMRIALDEVIARRH